MDEQNSGTSGNNEPIQVRAMYYNRDGTPIEGPHPTLEWAKLFEDTKGRIIGRTTTLYGEKLSTVWLGLDHNYSMKGPPIIFETMLFAPESDELKKAKRMRITKIADSFYKEQAIEEMETFAEEEYIKKHYPHDACIQERYATEAQAKAGHRKLKLQCLIPPRWRRFLLYTIGKDETWE